MHYIYKITNIRNNKIYIGQSKEPRKRWYEHKRLAASPQPKLVIQRALKKYGNDAFEFEVIASCRTADDADATEIAMIAQYQSNNNIFGYNIASGGRSPRWSISMRQKLVNYYKDHPERRAELRRRALTNESIRHNQFKRGHYTWNKNLKGIHLNPANEFQPGMHHSLATEFKPGEHPSPATEIKKNQRLSPETEFKKGHIPANKKLTTQQEQEILTKWQNGQSKRSLAREYKIDRSSIQRITDKG